VVALMLTAAHAGAPGRRPADPGGGAQEGGGPAGSAIARVPAPRPAWELSLDEVLAEPTGQEAPTPLAVELALSAGAGRGKDRWQQADGQQVMLAARLVQAGRAGAWSAGSLTWSRLDMLHYYGSYSPAQVQVLQEIYALHRSRRPSYEFYRHGEDKHIDLLAFDSGYLWQLLDAAWSAGIRLVYPRKLGEIGRYRQGELCLDVTGAGSLGQPMAIKAELRVADEPAELAPLQFIGVNGHGVVYADLAETEASNLGSLRFRLARLAAPAPAALRALALSGRRLEIPPAEQVRFRDGYYPRLRRTATVLSSDGTFTPPVISAPRLVLLATYGDGHQLDLRWEWSYQVGDSDVRVPPENGPGAGDDPIRDTAAERQLLAGLDLPLEDFGLAGVTAFGRNLAGPVGLTGIDTMRFSTELLPLISDRPDVRAELSGHRADYREASDSLRISVSAGEVAGDTDWFDLGVSITAGGQTVPFADVFVALSQGQSHLLLPDGAYFSLDKPELQALAALIGEARTLSDAPPGELRISRFQAGLWEELSELGITGHQAAAWQEQVTGLLAAGSLTRPDQPAGLHATLRPYQLDGFSWLAFLWQHQLGGILADDMGLGKTLQSLALICHARQPDGPSGQAGPPFLIVAPTSVVPNWVAEAARFAPGLKVVPVHETGARRGIALGSLVAGADAVVTSYTLLRMDAESYAAQPWSGMILDEAQFTKNHQSRLYQCARRVPAPVKIAITGTPMENNLMELWSLLSITAPGLFPHPERFREYYARPIEKGNPELIAQLRRRIKPLVRRRTKEQVAADLPPKQEQVLEVDLHPKHRKIYQTHLQRERQKVLGLIEDMNANRFTIFRSLTLLRQLSLHAGLVEPDHADLASAKIDVLAEHLSDVIGGGHRALVFSQFTGFLRLVRERLDADGVPYCYLDGSTRDRASVIERFRSGSVPVFLISLKAGGFGLNLTEADYCFLLDPWWNPATEAQAVDRTHRIGQTRNVMVYRLIARDTIEEKVMALKARKAELFTSVMDEGNAFGASIDASDIRELFT
jgi:superfamily II DNA or RNA helicase